MSLLKEDGVESVYLLLKVVNVKKGRLGPRNLIWKLTMLLGKIIGRAYPTEPIFLVLFNDQPEVGRIEYALEIVWLLSKLGYVQKGYMITVRRENGIGQLTLSYPKRVTNITDQPNELVMRNMNFKTVDHKLDM